MADGLCTGNQVGCVKQVIPVKNFDTVMECLKNKSRVNGDTVNEYFGSESGFLDKLSRARNEHGGDTLEDCRKKRCVDRYDSSESSDSGVAVLSCTDCSGSSTASSDITEPGSPFSTSSSHSEDSSQPATKMPPTQQTAHQPWPWATDEEPPLKRSNSDRILDKGLLLLDKRVVTDKTALLDKRLLPDKGPPLLHKKTLTDKEPLPINKRSFPEKNALSKRFKSTTDDALSKQSPPCLPTAQNNKIVVKHNLEVSSINNNNNYRGKRIELVPKMQQGKITEYFKSQMKANGLKNLIKKSVGSKLVDRQTQFNSLKTPITRKDIRVTPSSTKKANERKKYSPSVPRKILPAPSKVTEKMTINNQINNIANFTPTVTLTAVSFPPNLAYLHTKTPKPPDNIFMPQIPIISRAPCLNVIQPVHQKITTINNFNCVKLNATVVPIVKLNALPSRVNESTASPNLGNMTLSVETALPTVLTARSKPSGCSITTSVPVSPTLASRQFCTSTSTTTVSSSSAKTVLVDSGGGTLLQQFRTEETIFRTSECEAAAFRKKHDESVPSRKEVSPSPTDSDSGISLNREFLEVCVSDETVLVEQQKSPILSQPKTIRFPAKKEEHKEEKEKSLPDSKEGRCRWEDCNVQFDTSGALLEHLQVKHVISQANQEQYVCLWLGCKVHGRTSCSRSWLERHVLAHAGTKPFRCIVDGCGQRFNSQLMLERHVNSHFNGDGTPNNNTKKATENGPVKLFKRNGRIIRFRRQPWSARMFDFIDSGIMEGLQHKLLMMTQKRTLGNISKAGDTVSLQSQILARRIDSDGSTKLLLRWHPTDVVPDEWVQEKDYRNTKMVPIPDLRAPEKDALHPTLFPLSAEKSSRKHRRKPIKQQTT